ncbi:MAG: M24 family metallopeptidase [Candidatus Lokiarchaeota archaeon]|nr:M24 family metallopeptidase [Candidatus Lokiarchaeota archaeon]
MLEDLDKLMEDRDIDALIAKGNAFEIPDIFWLTGFRSPDSIIYFKQHDQDGVVAAAANTLERIKKQSFIEATYDLTETYTEMMKEGKRPSNEPKQIFGEIFDKLFDGDVVGVPNHLPSNALVALQEIGLDIKVVPNLLKNGRATKNADEIKAIRKAGEATVAAFKEIVQTIKDAEIGENSRLMSEGKPLTVRDIKLELEHALLDRRAELAEDSIVAVGQKGFDWHYLGNLDDVLKAGEPIIIDVFPRLKEDRYVADVTRTIVKGEVDDELQAMFDAVVDALHAVEDTLAAGAMIDEDVNMACYKTLEKHGFKSSRLDPEAKEGMTHGLGHGIGLEVHEYPFLYDRESAFESGNVVAIEPGVYIESVGGVRIENDYVVTDQGAERLTTGLDDLLFL